MSANKRKLAQQRLESLQTNGTLGGDYKNTSNGSVHGQNGHRKISETVVQRKMIPKPPDGGWGWVIVFCSFMIHVIADGVTYTFGIFYVELVRYFGQGKGLTAWVPSIMTGVTYGIGPIASGLTNKFGCRSITIAGSILATVGLMTSVLATNVTTLFFTIGICAGAGFGLIYLPAIVSVTMYFERRRAFATGIAVCGSGIGSALFAPLTDWLIQAYGWKGAMVIISALILNCCVFGALLRPLEPTETLTVTVVTGNTTTNTTVTTEEDDDNEDNEKKLGEKYPMITADSNFQKDSNYFITEPDSPDILDYSVSSKDYGLLDLDPAASSPSRHSFSAFKLSHSHVPEPRPLYTSLEVVSMLPIVKVTRAPANHSSQQDTTRSRKTSWGSGHSDHRPTSYVLGRKDIFYSRSLNNIPEYRSNPAIYSASMSTLDRTDGLRPSGKSFLCCPQEMLDTFTEMMDFTILANPVFLVFAVSNFITSLGYYVPHIYLKDRVVDSNMASDQEASNLLAIIGIGSTLGRVVFGYLSDHSFVNRLWLYNSCLTICGLSTVFSTFAPTYGYLAIYAAVFGVSCGAYVSLTSVILVDLLGLEKLTNAFGVLLLFQGVACLVGPPIIGWLYDLTGSYTPGFHLAGAAIAISGLMLFAIPSSAAHCVGGDGQVIVKLVQNDEEESKKPLDTKKSPLPIVVIA